MGLSDYLSGPPFAPHVPLMYPPLNPGAGEGDQKKAQLVFRESKYFHRKLRVRRRRRRPRAARLIARATSRKLTDRVSTRSTRNIQGAQGAQGRWKHCIRNIRGAQG